MVTGLPRVSLQFLGVLGVLGFGFRVSGFGFRVQSAQAKFLPLPPEGGPGSSLTTPPPGTNGTTGNTPESIFSAATPQTLSPKP